MDKRKSESSIHVLSIDRNHSTQHGVAILVFFRLRAGVEYWDVPITVYKTIVEDFDLIQLARSYLADRLEAMSQVASAWKMDQAQMAAIIPP